MTRGDTRLQLLEGLNPAQLEAVTTPAGPLLILAGPGSGKTRVITHRIAYLIQHEMVLPHSIMAVTFTNKAASEMRLRLEKLVGPPSEGLTVGTFHATCARILRRDGHYIGLDPSFVIYDDDDQISLVKSVLKELELDDKRYPARPFLSAISSAKSELKGPQEYGEFTTSYWQEVASRVYRRYQDQLKTNRALDFDDLLMSTVQLFRNCPEVLARYHDRYHQLLVDEFQDTNIAQYAIVKQLGERCRNVCVVGDPDQSIYSWRSADIRNILNFEQDYPDLKTVVLEQNYRSTTTILEAAQGVIAPNVLRKEKKLWTENGHGDPITLFEAYDEGEESKFVAREIERLAAREGHSLKDFAVMYRTNAQSRALEDAFLRYGLRYKLVGGTRFYERREVKDVISFLRLIQNPGDGVSAARVVNVPARGIGARTVAEIDRLSKQRGVSLFEAMEIAVAEEPDGKSPTTLAPRVRNATATFVKMVNELVEEKSSLGILDLLDRVLEKTGYRAFLLDGTEEGQERWENVMELRTVARDYETLNPESALDAFLEGMALMSDVDGLKEEEDGVTLITLHAAKGLEYPCVLIVGLEDGICPHSRSVDDPAALEEERRLFYVGITRAMKRLWLVYATRRTLYGNVNFNQPSRFLTDIPASLVDFRGSATSPSGKAESPFSSPSKRADSYGGYSGGSQNSGVLKFPSRGTGAGSGGGTGSRPKPPTPSWSTGGPSRSGSTPQRPTPMTPRSTPMDPRTPPTPLRPTPTQMTPGMSGGPVTPPEPKESTGEPTFKAGDRVYHPAFGNGIVVSSRLLRGDEEVTVAFDQRGVKKLALSFAPLQRQ
jgi:DNA helicase II / ATP-dependent DNA helicase PcrA